MTNPRPDLDAHLSDSVVYPTEFPDSCEKCDCWQRVTIDDEPTCLYYEAFSQCLADQRDEDAHDRWEAWDI